MPLRVTWIAPAVKGYPDLAWLNELGRIQSIRGVEITTRTGDEVKLDDVSALLSLPADVMVWSGHGTAGGLLLSDGVTLVQPRWLAIQVAFGAHPRVSVLAACGSQNRDAGLRSLTEIMSRAGVDVVGFPAEADDMAAGTFTVELIRALSLKSKVIDAFDVAMESISEASTARGVFFTPGIRDVGFNIESILLEIQESIDALTSVGGEPKKVSPTRSTTRSATKKPSILKESDIKVHVGGHLRGIADTGPTPPVSTDATPALTETESAATESAATESASATDAAK